MKVGDRVRVRGRYAHRYSVAGVIEVVREDSLGVRFVNGNFGWFPAKDVKKEDDQWQWQRRRAR